MPSQYSNPADPDSPQHDPALPPPGDSEIHDDPVAPRHRRRWPWVILVILLILVALVILAPTIASTAPVRSFVVGKLNNNLNGRVAIDDWSLGWTSGILLEDVRLYDEKNAEIFHAPRIRTDMTLIQAARGRYELGETVIDVANIVLRVDEQGKTNLDQIVKEPRPPKREHQSDELPNVSGKISINIANGTIVAPNQPAVHLQPSTIVLDIEDINQPIRNDITLAYRVGSDPAGRIATSGSIDAIHDNRVDLEKLNAQQKMALTSLNLAALAPFFATAAPNMTVGGVANGQLDVTAQGMTGISADGQLLVDEFLLGGEVLNGDTFQSSRLTIPIQITRSGDGSAAVVRVEQLAVQMPEVEVSLTGEVSQLALINLMDQKPPGASGNLQLSIRSDDIAKVANQLSNTLNLQAGVKIESGKFAQVSNFTFQPAQLKIQQTVDISAEGTNKGRPVKLNPIHIETGLAVIPTGKRLPNMRDIKLAMQSAFAQIEGDGGSLAALNIRGEFDLDKLHAEAAQFVEMGNVDLAGTGNFKITTSGDLTSESDPIAASVTLNLTNMRVSGVSDRPIDENRLALVASANITRENGSAKMLENGKLSLTSQLVNVEGTGNANLQDRTVPSFELVKFEAPNLPQAQDAYGWLIPQLAENNIRIDNGAIYANAAGKYENNTVTFSKPLAVSLPALTLTKDGRQVLRRETVRATLNGSISMPEEGLAANLSDLTVTTQSNLLTIRKSGAGDLKLVTGPDGALRGNGALSVAADLKRLNDIAQSFGGQVVTADQPQLASGQFSGTLTLLEHPQHSIEFAGELVNLTVAANRATPVRNEKVTIALKGTAPAESQTQTPFTGSGQISSSFMTANLSDVRVMLGSDVWNLVQSAHVQANVPDLPKLHALINAFLPPESPPAAAAAPVQPVAAHLAGLLQVSGDDPISRPRPQRDERPAPAPAPAPARSDPQQPPPPLEVTSGQATIDLKLNRDTTSHATNVTVSNAKIENVTLKRGPREHKVDPITFNLTASIVAAHKPDTTLLEQINAIQITQLGGDAGFVDFAMGKPITITDVASDAPKASGAIAANGRIERLTPVLAMLNGSSELPYSGEFSLTQNIRNDGDAIVLAGEILTRQFQVFDSPARENAIFTEDQLAVRNDLSVNPKTEVAMIKTLTVDMPGSKAVGVNMTGGVAKWTTQRQFQNVKLDLTYDLAKIWPIVKPMLSPQTQEELKDLKVAGQYSKSFVIAGALPANVPFNESIGQLDATGEFSLQSLDALGIILENLNLPLNLNNGKLVIEYAGRARDQRLPSAASCNGGQLDLGGIAVDLTQPTPRLDIPRDKRLLRDISINPLLGEKLGKYVNPMFPNSQRARGLLDLTVNYAENVALGESVKTSDSGRARIVFSIRDLDVANPLGSLMLGPILNVIKVGNLASSEADTFQGRIENAVVTLENGRTTQDITLLLVDPNRAADVVGAREPQQLATMPMRFQGDVRLSDLSQSINVSMPTGLVGKFLRSDKDRQNIARIFPQGIPLALRGTTVAPKVDIGNIAGQIVRGLAESEIRDALGGDKRDDGSGGDGLGGLLDDVLKRREREKERDKERERPRDEPPPR